MITLFTNELYKKSKGRDKLLLKCKFCEKEFFALKHNIQKVFSGSKHLTLDFCCLKCSNDYRSETKNITLNCGQCNKKITKLKKYLNLSKSKKLFCCHSCSAKYSNTHKTTGCSVSKMELYIQEQLNILFPTPDFFKFNKKDDINSELDIYIPSLKLAFELNGIFHYEPIFGKEQLSSIQNNDNRKIQACIEREIEFCIIDISSVNYFKPEKAQKYLDIIINLIRKKMQNYFLIMGNPTRIELAPPLSQSDMLNHHTQDCI